MKIIDNFKNVLSNMFAIGGVNKKLVPLGIIATRDTNYLETLTKIMPNPDLILQKNNATLEVYNELLCDAHLSSCVQSRKSGTMSLEWQIVSKDEDLNNFVTDILNKINIRQVVSEILDATLFGFKPLEINWQYVNNFVLPVAVEGKPPWWFEFDKWNTLRFKRKFGDSVAVPPRKFLIPKHNATYANPYGEALLSKCFYPVLFKKGTLKLWTTYAERFGMPRVHGQLDVGKTVEEAKELFNMLEQLQQDGVIVTDDNVKIQFLDSNSNYSTDVYRSLIVFCNAEISKVILSQTLTTEQGDTGSYAMSQTHLQVRKDVIDADKKLVEYWINKLIEWIIEFNFGKTAETPKFIMFEEEDVDTALASRDAQLAATRQIQFTKAYFTRNYGFKDDEIEVINLNEQIFAEPETPETPETKTQKELNLLEELEDETRKLIEQILSQIDANKSLDEIENALIEQMPHYDLRQIKELISQAIVIASISGRIDAIS